MKSSIQKKIVTNSVLLVGLVLLVLGLSSVLIMYQSAMNSVRTNMTEMVSISSERAEWEMISYVNIAKGLGSINRMSDPDLPNEDKQEILDEWAERYELERCNLIFSDGKDLRTPITPTAIILKRQCRDKPTYPNRSYQKQPDFSPLLSPHPFLGTELP